MAPGANAASHAFVSPGAIAFSNAWSLPRRRSSTSSDVFDGEAVGPNLGAAASWPLTNSTTNAALNSLECMTSPGFCRRSNLTTPSWLRRVQLCRGARTFLTAIHLRSARAAAPGRREVSTNDTDGERDGQADAEPALDDSKAT